MSLRFILLGHPVAHSMSPAIHYAAYRELGLDHAYELIDADEARVRSEVERLKRGEIAGANVTIPWKLLALTLADSAEASAAAIGAANVLVRQANGSIRAHNTDVPALSEELSRLHASPKRILVIGSGGAARAVIASCLALGAEVGLVARRFRGSDPAAFEGAAEFVKLGAKPLGWPASDPAMVREFSRGVDLVVQASSAGMHGADPGDVVAELVPWSELAPGAAAYDLVYNPPETPFLRAARRAGLAAADGLGMLVGQAALSIQLWLGVTVRREPLLSAARTALEARRR